MIKVLQVGAKNYPPAHGGTERVVYNIVNSIPVIDFYILVEWKQEETDRIFIIPEKLGYFSKMSFIRNFARQNKIDIIHFHNEKYIPMAILLSFGFKKTVLTVHGVHYRSPKFSFFNRIGLWVVDVLGTLFLPRMVHCSEYDQKAFSKYIFFRKTYFVNNGTNICETRQMEEDIKYPDTYIYLGRITPAKNIVGLIEAADLKGIKVHLYGILDKECADYCKLVLDMVDKSKYVEYKGVVPYNEVFDTMKKYRAFLYVTIMEGLPLSVLEAASCGMFLILSKIPHHVFLNLPAVEYVDVKKPLLPYPKDVGNGYANREFVLANFSNQKMGAEYLKIYQSF